MEIQIDTQSKRAVKELTQRSKRVKTKNGLVVVAPIYLLYNYNSMSVCPSDDGSAFEWTGGTVPDGRILKTGTGPDSRISRTVTQVLMTVAPSKGGRPGRRCVFFFFWFRASRGGGGLGRVFFFPP
jgi:hypothetical protein